MIEPDGKFVIADTISPYVYWFRYAWVGYVAAVQLTQEQIELAVSAGRRLNKASKDKGDIDKKFARTDGESVHIHGAACEIGVCTLFGLKYHTNEGTYRKADLPFNIEVKGHRKGNYDCRIKPDEPDNHLVVMAVMERLDKPVWIIGWIKAKDGKRFPTDTFETRNPSSHKRANPNHRVPKSKLRRIWPLRKWVMERQGLWKSEYEIESFVDCNVNCGKSPVEQHSL